MGNNQSFNSQIDKQEKWVQQRFDRIDPKTTTSSVGGSYSARQIKGALRQDYYGRRSGGCNDYVLKGDWDRMNKK